MGSRIKDFACLLQQAQLITASLWKLLLGFGLGMIQRTNTLLAASISMRAGIMFIEYLLNDKNA